MSYQKWIKWESERYIINSLYDGDRSFTDLVHLTDLSKPVLSQRLKELTKEGKIENIPRMETKTFLYHLNPEKVDIIDEISFKIHILSKAIVSYLTGLTKDPSISDEEYSTRLAQGISMLLSFNLYLHMVAPLDIQGEWLKTTLGLEFVRNSARLLPENRNILKYVVKGMPSKESTIFKAEDIGEIAKEILEFLNTAIEIITRK